MDIFNHIGLWTELLSYYPLFIKMSLYIYINIYEFSKINNKNNFMQLWYVNDI